MTWWWLSSRRMTVGVAVDETGVVRDAAPIVRRFVGQHADRLSAWMGRQGGLLAERIA